MNHYIFVVTDQSKYGKFRSASEAYNLLMENNLWGFGEHTKHRKDLQTGDRAVFYQAGGDGQKFLGTAVLDSGAYKESEQNDLFLEPETYSIDLKDVDVWESPKQVGPLLGELSFIEDKDYWGVYFQGGCRKISKKDYEKIVRSSTSNTEISKENKGFWAVRMGKGGKYVRELKDRNILALGWSKIRSLDKIDTREDLLSKVKKNYSDKGSSHAAGQLWRFYEEMKSGDFVLVPHSAEGKIFITRVKSDYYYKKDKFKFPHRRKVEILKIISRSDCSQQLKHSLGSLLTVFSIEDYADEIIALVEGREKEEQVDDYEDVYDAVINRLFELNPKEFEEFIEHLLSIIGFESAVTQLVGDKGVDVEGKLNPEGLAQVDLKVQVKRVHGSLGNNVVLKTRGTLGPDEHGCIVTLSKFTKSAIEEAEDEDKKPISLIDGEGLVDLILSHYEDLKDEYRSLIGVKPKEVSWEDRFDY